MGAGSVGEHKTVLTRSDGGCMSKQRGCVINKTGELLKGRPSTAFTVIGLANLTMEMNREETREWEIKLPADPEPRRTYKQKC